MNSIESIIEQEKAVTYDQRNKQLFSFYTLTLIAQEQVSRRLQKRAGISLLLIIAFLLLFLAPISSLIEGFVASLSTLDIIDIFKMGALNYGLVFIFYKFLKKGQLFSKNLNKFLEELIQEVEKELDEATLLMLYRN